MRGLIGHNGGPRLDDRDTTRGPGAGYRLACWKRAHDHAWKSIPRDVMMLRLARAECLGLTCREYTLEILERGVYLQASDAGRIAEIIARRPQSP